MGVRWMDWAATAAVRRWQRTLAIGLLTLASAGCPVLVLAQDMSVVAILQPTSGCALTAEERISVRVRNYGPTLPGGSTFTMSYTINNGAPVGGGVLMGNMVVPNGEFTHHFVTPADLSAPGIYLIDATITVAGDGNPVNNRFVAEPVQNWAASAGGSIADLPAPTAMGTLNLSGHTGTVLEWQQSTDLLRWRALENTTTTQAFSALSEPTHFRVRVQNGPCAPALSNPVLVTAESIFSNGFEP
jgi:hypothetical protein